MVVLCSALIIMLNGLLAPAGAVVIPERFNAFNEYVMEAPLAEYPSLRRVRTASSDLIKDLGTYENPGESVTVNGVPFLSVRYRFADQRLESIQLIYKNRENRDKLLEWLERQYGRVGPSQRKMVNQVEWHGDRLAITLSYNPATQQGHLWFISPKLHRLVNEGLGAMPD